MTVIGILIVENLLSKALFSFGCVTEGLGYFDDGEEHVGVGLDAHEGLIDHCGNYCSQLFDITSYYYS